MSKKVATTSFSINTDPFSPAADAGQQNGRSSILGI
jgi:hypothetical protein